LFLGFFDCGGQSVSPAVGRRNHHCPGPDSVLPWSLHAYAVGNPRWAFWRRCEVAGRTDAALSEAGLIFEYLGYMLAGGLPGVLIGSAISLQAQNVPLRAKGSYFAALWFHYRGDGGAQSSIVCGFRPIQQGQCPRPGSRWLPLITSSSDWGRKSALFRSAGAGRDRGSLVLLANHSSGQSRTSGGYRSVLRSVP